MITVYEVRIKDQLRFTGIVKEEVIEFANVIFDSTGEVAIITEYDREPVDFTIKNESEKVS
jgi:hypothetical protein